MKVKRYIKILLLIFAAAFIVGTLTGCKKETITPQCTTTLNQVDTIAYNGEIVQPTHGDFMLSIPVDVYFFIDSIRIKPLPYSEIQNLFDKVNNTFARVRSNGVIKNGAHYFRFYPRNTVTINETATIDDYYYNQNKRDSLIQNEIDDWDAVNLLFFENTGTLNGFAPTLIENLDELEHLKYNNAWVGLTSFERYESTVAHEFFHLFGGVHPFELKEKAPQRYKALNLDYKDVKYNLGNYGCYVDHITIEQLSSMYINAINYRNYLIE